jgi:fumarylpyruvate hydrolase
MTTAIPLPAPVLLPMAHSDQTVPDRRGYCGGRNCAAHAIETGHDPNRETPFFFQKNPDNLRHAAELPYPPLSTGVHHEVELVVPLKQGGDAIGAGDALDCVYGYAVGIDFTRRELQAQAKAAAPLDGGKGLRTVCAHFADPAGAGDRTSGGREYQAEDQW